jgi:tetratricopeptide (TPR) repeat protein
VGLVVYRPALHGAFLSDDQHYVWDNPYVHELSPRNVLEILNPRSPLLLVVENYAPVHLLLHALEWQVFGERTYGYHVVNVALHAFASLLLVIFFRRSGIPGPAALFGGAFFLVHAANVEAVAWISQLKSSAALVLAVGALLAQPRRPLAGTLLFALALFAKPSALFALPVAAVATWVERGADRARWRWLGAWLAVFAAFAVVELFAFSQTAAQASPLYADAWVRLRSAAAIGLRYLVMAASTWGLSTFHEPPPAASWLDPWWLGGLGALALLAWRAAVVFRARRVECVYWTWAAASWAAVSGLLPLPFPMADRYLYAILPGLVGALLLAGLDAVRALEARARRADPARLRRGAAPVAVALGAAWLALLAWRSFERAHVWRSAQLVMVDAERNYPDGTAAKTRQAVRAARAGDIESAVALLRQAHARGYNRLDHLLQEPAYAAYRDDPRFHALLVEFADGMIEHLGRNPSPSQLELRVLALAHEVRGDRADALRALERALEVGGPIDEEVERDLADLRRRQRLQERAAGR